MGSKKLKDSLVLSSNLFVLFFMCLILAPTSKLLAQEDIDKLFRELSEIDKPLELRDPFQPQITVEKKSTSKPDEKDQGVFTNVPTLGPVRLEDIKITGVLIGSERRAFVTSGAGGTTFTIKEGMKLGPNEAEVKAILPGGMILVEKVVNIYGETEYLETVIPISK